MNYLAALLGIALLGAISTAAVYRGDAASYHEQLISLKASYAETAQKAKDDAAAQEAKDTAALKLQSSAATQQAAYAKNQAQLAAATYQQKLAQLSGKPKLDIGHQCAITPIPADLIP